MDLFLKILGVILIIILMGIAVTWFIIRRWWKKASLATQTTMPSEIKLIENSDAAWTRQLRIQHKFDEFKLLGFEPTKVFLPALNGIEMQFFSNPTRQQHGVIYNTPLGFNEEFSAEDFDGLNINVTNFEHSARFTHNSDKIIYGMPLSSIAEIHTKFMTLIEGRALKTIQDEDLAEFIEDGHRKSTGGLYKTGACPMWEDLYPAYIERWSDKGSEEVLREVFTQSVTSQLNEVTDELYEELKQSETISSKQWNQYQENLLLVNPRIDRIGFARYLSEKFFLEDGDVKTLDKFVAESSDSQQVLEMFIDYFKQFKITKLTSTDKPFEAMVYGFERQEDI